jgi:hypothetical protein
MTRNSGVEQAFLCCSRGAERKRNAGEQTWKVALAMLGSGERNREMALQEAQHQIGRARLNHKRTNQSIRQ